MLLNYSWSPSCRLFVVLRTCLYVQQNCVYWSYNSWCVSLQVPELAGFWLLSLLLQLPLILFLLLNEGLRNLPLEKAIHIIFTIFLTFQVISAFLTLKKMVNQLAARFHLQDFDRLSANSAAMPRRRQPLTEELWSHWRASVCEMTQEGRGSDRTPEIRPEKGCGASGLHEVPWRQC